MMKIAVVGPGAIGSLLAAYLSKSKEEIWILDKSKERAQRIAKSGLKIEGVSGNWKVDLKATEETSAIGKVDLVIICVKSYDTKEAILRARALIDEESVVLTVQNGIGNIEIISEVIGGEDRVLGGVTNQGATLLDTGCVRHAGKGETIIGSNSGKISVKMRAIREIFNKVGLPTRISRDIKGLLWSKLIINVGINALTAITRLNNARLIEYEGTRKILRAAVTEATRVAKRKRIKLLYDDPLAKVEAVCEATAANISSMLQDILRKKRTEIEFINGVIVRLGQELNIPVPVNSCLSDLVRTIESSYAQSL